MSAWWLLLLLVPVIAILVWPCKPDLMDDNWWC